MLVFVFVALIIGANILDTDVPKSNKINRLQDRSDLSMRQHEKEIRETKQVTVTEIERVKEKEKTNNGKHKGHNK